MAIKSKDEMPNGITIDLTGPDGNSFALLGYAKNLCKQLRMQYGPIADEMTSGDYEHLLEVFEKYFGSFVTLYR
tara:strand:+ start:1553 stop:1774 length:222 start_codon:yes stop_codon:yes gene_type:complete